MELLFNDLSVEGQFPNPPAFHTAISRVMLIREMARRYGREVACHRNVCQSRVCNDSSLQEVIGSFDKNEQRALMQWLTRFGPFLEELRTHGPDDYLECNSRVVTDTAIGEAAFCRFHGVDRRLISLSPSSWNFTPLNVVWSISDGTTPSIDVENYWDMDELEAALRSAPANITSWEQLEEACKLRFVNLFFSDDCFSALRGLPFADGAVYQLLTRFDILNRFKSCFDEKGQRTAEGQRIYQDHFTGDNAWFSDSSDKEKHEFEKVLTFSHPEVMGQTLFCTWHGKIKYLQIRIHFSWPVRAENPLYVVFVGQKLTKQ